MFDLVLKGATVLDPGQGIDGALDIAVAGGKIAALEPQIAEAQAARILNLSGCLAVPGLIDLHTHVYPGVTWMGAEADEICLKDGVTTTVDGGSCGPDTFGGFKRWVVEASRTRVYCFLHLSRLGLTGVQSTGELANQAYADPKGALNILQQYPDVAVGLKLRLPPEMIGGPCIPMVKIAREVAGEAGKPVMVHISESIESMAQVLLVLAAGDIVTHFQTPKRHGLLDEAGRLLPQAVEARQRGVLFDCAHGMTHFSLEVAQRLLDQGFPPDTISTDLSKNSFPKLAPGLITVMNKWLALGMPAAEVVRRATRRPAEILGKTAEFGGLKPGLVADITVLRWEEGEFTLTDAYGGARTLRRRLVPHSTIRNGQPV